VYLSVLKVHKNGVNVSGLVDKELKGDSYLTSNESGIDISCQLYAFATIQLANGFQILGRNLEYVAKSALLALLPRRKAA